MRREAGFEVCDHIIVYYHDSPELSSIIEKNSALIAEDVLAVQIIAGISDGYNKEWDINGRKASITIIKAI